MRRIDARVIPHDEQRYPTVGDYFTEHRLDGNVEHFRVSQMSDDRYEHLVLIHELVERVICEYAGIDNAEIDEFDTEYERNRKPGDESEPGDDPNAPYYQAHQVATIVERTVAYVLGVDWKKYEREVNSLGEGTCGTTAPCKW